MGKASMVGMQIESKVGSIKGLFAEIASILREIAALKAPENDVGILPAGATDKQKAAHTKKQEAFNQKMTKFQGDVDDLNTKLVDVQGKLDKAQKELSKLEQQDLPQAQQQDVRDLQKAMEQAQETLAAATGAADEAEGPSTNDLTTKHAKKNVRIQMVRTEVGIQISIKTGDDADFGAAKSGDATKMPPTPATGI
jgi:chromosome segregation ATPase